MYLQKHLKDIYFISECYWMLFASFSVIFLFLNVFVFSWISFDNNFSGHFVLLTNLSVTVCLFML